MKKYIYLVALFLVTLVNYSQTGITYQAVILKPNGTQLPGVNNTAAPLINTAICLEFTILDSNSQTEYQETLTIVTDAFGMVNTLIGTGVQTGGYATSFASVDWNNAQQKALKVALDVKGLCSNFVEISSQNFSSVPFAFSATNAENVTGIVPIVNGGTNATTVIGAKTNLGLENVDNTSDLNKPISTATQNALNLKENSANKSIDGTLATNSDIKFPTELAVKTYVNTSSAANAAALAAEVTRATAAENTLTSNLATEVNRATTAENTLTTNLATEVTRATAAEDTLTTNLTAEVTRATTAENTLTTNLAAEVTRATTAENTLTTNLATEITRATTAEATKEDAVNKSTDVTLADVTNTKFPTEQAVKTYVDASSTANAAALANEVNRATAAENNLTTNLTNEVNRATTAEATKEDAVNKSTDGTLATNSDIKFPTEQAVKTYVDASSTANSNALAVEVNRATDAENTLNNNLVNEIARAITAEATKENSANKSTDVTLADVTNIKFPTEKAVKTYVDGSSAANAAALNVEINNRTTADATLQSNINSLTTTVTANATTAANADTALQSNINNLSVTVNANATTAANADTTLQSNINALSATVSANATTAANATALKENSANKSIDVNLADVTNTKFPTEKAVKTYVDGKIFDATPSFATGTTGTDFNIRTTGTATTFNIPDASLTNRGVVTTSDQTFAGAKTFGADVTINGNAKISGKLSANGGNASGDNSTALGAYTSASGSFSTAMGKGTTASRYASTAIGDSTTASGDYSTAMGVFTNASGDLSTAMGRDTTASGVLATAMGEGTIASGVVATAMGSVTTASGVLATAMGNGTIASGVLATAMGNQTNAKSFAETAIGTNNTDYTPNSTNSFTAADRLFVIGNGVDGGNKSDAMVVLKNGNTTINGTTTATSFIKAGGHATDYLMADGTTSAGPDLSNIQTNFVTTTSDPNNITNVNTGNVGIGTTTPTEKLDVAGNAKVSGRLSANGGNASGLYSVAMGQGTTASGLYSVAMGQSTIASGIKSTAMGQGTIASGIFATAMGFGTTADGNSSTAMGNLTSASGGSSTAMGDRTTASGFRSTAMGTKTTATSYGETAIGTNNTNYAATSPFTYNSTDRLFVIGNGIDDNNKSDAMVVLKNGNTTINGEVTVTKIKIPNGQAYQYLMADGTTSLGTAFDNEADEEFLAAGAETTFVLANTPRANSKVKMYINGIRISKTAYTVVGANLAYNPALNGNYSITANDRIQFEYFY